MTLRSSRNGPQRTPRCTRCAQEGLKMIPRSPQEGPKMVPKVLFSPTPVCQTASRELIRTPWPRPRPPLPTLQSFLRHRFRSPRVFLSGHLLLLRCLGPLPLRKQAALEQKYMKTTPKRRVPCHLFVSVWLWRGEVVHLSPGFLMSSRCRGEGSKRVASNIGPDNNSMQGAWVAL